MTKLCHFHVGWNGRSLDIRADLVDPAEVDRLIRAIEANRWLLAPTDADARSVTADTQTGLSLTDQAEQDTKPALALPVEPVKRDVEITPESKASTPKPVADKPLLAGQRLRQVLPQLWTSDLSSAEIGARYGLTGSRVSQIAKDLGLPPKISVLKRDDLNQLVTDLWAGELTKAEIAERLGVSVSTVGRIVSDLGLPSRLQERRSTTFSEESRESREPQMAAPVEASPPAGQPTTTTPVDGDPPASAPPEIAAEPVDSAPEPVEAPAAVAEPEPAPAVQHAKANGHAPAGKLVVSTNGIELREESIVYGDRSMAISTMELRALTVVLRASPSPVGVPFILKRAWPRVAPAVAESQLMHACKRLRERLPEIGLALHSQKGVGVAIGVAA